jgi:hypothetical protein
MHALPMVATGLSGLSSPHSFHDEEQSVLREEAAAMEEELKEIKKRIQELGG